MISFVVTMVVAYFGICWLLALALCRRVWMPAACHTSNVYATASGTDGLHEHLQETPLQHTWRSFVPSVIADQPWWRRTPAPRRRMQRMRAATVSQNPSGTWQQNWPGRQLDESSLATHGRTIHVGHLRPTRSKRHVPVCPLRPESTVGHQTA